MLRSHQCMSAAAAQSYYTQGLQREDYYTRGQEIPGRWCGLGAALLGLPDAVQRDHFIALTENRHPFSGERLTPRTRAGRTIGYDLNFHAPKGVSLLHALGNDHRILDAFRSAVEATMTDIERAVRTRVRLDGRHEDRLTGNLAWAEFIHFTARPVRGVPDPHLHAHCFAMNCTFDDVEDRWKAGQFREAVREAPYWEACFHARLADALVRIGYPVERTGTGWDLAGLDRATIEKFSARTAQIEAVAAELGIDDPVRKATLGARTRQSKKLDLSLDDLRRRWDDRLTERERETLFALVQRASSKSPPESPEPPESPSDPSDRTRNAERALAHAIEHGFERSSVLAETRLLADALRHDPGAYGIEDVHAAFERSGVLRAVLEGRPHVTTPEVLAEEESVLAFARAGRGCCPPLGAGLGSRPGAVWEIADERLSAEQRQVVERVLASRDRVQVIRGRAGVGKTTLMQEAVRGIEHGGGSVHVFAPTAEASRGTLRERGFEDADTVARLLSDPELKKRCGGSVLWIDEAGLLGIRTMKRVFDLAETIGARIILSGDTQQHAPVERGDALRLLERRAGLQPAEVRTIRRQSGSYRDAIAALASDDVERGYAILEAMGAVREVPDAQREHALAGAYLETIAAGRTALVISPTHREGERVTVMIRDRLRAAQHLGADDREFVRYRDTGWTAAQRADPRNYAEGLSIRAHQHMPGIRAGAVCAVVPSNDPGRVMVRGPDGAVCALPLRHADRFQVYAGDRIGFAAGDRIRITRNGRSKDGRHALHNGSVHRVAGLTREGDLRLENGWIVDRGFGHWSHGYVTTSHAAQGRDVDAVFIAQSGESFTASSRQQFYVSASRGRRSVTIFTDDKAHLKRAIARSGARISATELMQHAALRARALLNARLGISTRRVKKTIALHITGPPRHSESGEASQRRQRPRRPRRGWGFEHER